MTHHPPGAPSLPGLQRVWRGTTWLQPMGARVALRQRRLASPLGVSQRMQLLVALNLHDVSGGRNEIQTRTPLLRGPK